MTLIPESPGAAAPSAAASVPGVQPSPSSARDGQPASSGPNASPSSLPSYVHTTGPWTAGRLFAVVPLSALAATVPTDETWYAITRGLFVGVTNIHAFDLAATNRVSGAGHRGYASQAAALAAFNAAWLDGAVEVVKPT
ncbi:hypothetical protein C8R43DRAFT_1142884 [Mycena crocata]|nr:hypothetical protein C8R43DRAFT_1142884 [Mycena crocata]